MKDDYSMRDKIGPPRIDNSNVEFFVDGLAGKRWVYTTLTITLPKDLKKQLEDWGAQGWYEAELGDGPEPEPERPEQRKYEGDEAFRKVLRKAGIAPMKEKEKPLVLETFSKFEMDEAGKVG